MKTEISIILGSVGALAAIYKILHSSIGKAFDKLEDRVKELEKNTVGKEQLNELLKLHLQPINGELANIKSVLGEISEIRAKK